MVETHFLIDNKMTNNARHTVFVALLMAAAAAIIALALPHNAIEIMPDYETGRPWRNPTLIAPFDIPIELDTATRRRVTDSVNTHFVHIYRRDVQRGEQQVALLTKSLYEQGSSVNPAVRPRLVALAKRVYADGIVDNDASDAIRAGKMPRIRILGNDKVAQVVSTRGMHSVREAYSLIDSSLTASGAHDALSRINVSNFLTPNILLDEEEDTKLLNDALSSALTPKAGLVQMGEAIIYTGNVVTPEKASVLNTFKRMLEERDLHRDNGTGRWWGQLIMVVALLAMFFFFMRRMRPKVFADSRRMIFLISFVTLFVVAALVVMTIKPNFTYLVPFALVPIIVATFFDARSAFFTHLIVMLICSLVARNQGEFILLQFLAGTIAVAVARDYLRRSQLVVCALLIFAAYSVAFVAMSLVHGVKFEAVEWRTLLYFAVNCTVLTFAYVGTVFVEKIFGFTSKTTLVELSDINTPLLRRLAEECPGTFQHVLQVANIASEAALKIGANEQMVRAGALYHDIGKVENPAFFTENQTGVNPHDALAPEQSARIVIQHVTDGLRLADKARLPQVIKDLIAQHHGKGLTRYFYAQAVKANDGAAVDTAPFTYPGPNPQTREAAILMMADACEAAAKSLTDHSEKSIRLLVDKIVGGQIADGLLSESPITLHEVEVIKKVFVERLCAFYYTRISYPDDVKPSPEQ